MLMLVMFSEISDGSSILYAIWDISVIECFNSFVLILATVNDWKTFQQYGSYVC